MYLLNPSGILLPSRSYRAARYNKLNPLAVSPTAHKPALRPRRRTLARLTHIAAALALAPLLALSSGCANLPGQDPVSVQVAGVTPLPSEGLELRLAVKLRVVNPNDQPIEYDGVYVELDVADRSFATGVTDARGTVPRYGETVITVPTTASALSMVRQLIAVPGSTRGGKLSYRLRGKLGGTGIVPVRFEYRGEMGLPDGLKQ